MGGGNIEDGEPALSTALDANDIALPRLDASNIISPDVDTILWDTLTGLANNLEGFFGVVSQMGLPSKSAHG